MLTAIRKSARKCDSVRAIDLRTHLSENHRPNADYSTCTSSRLQNIRHRVSLATFLSGKVLIFVKVSKRKYPDSFTPAKIHHPSQPHDIQSAITSCHPGMARLILPAKIRHASNTDPRRRPPSLEYRKVAIQQRHSKSRPSPEAQGELSTGPQLASLVQKRPHSAILGRVSEKILRHLCTSCIRSAFMRALKGHMF